MRILILIVLFLMYLSGSLAEGQSSDLPSPCEEIRSIAYPNDVLTKLHRLGWQTYVKPLCAPNVELENFGGEKLLLSAYRSKLVFLTFWASWCPSCRAEMPSLERLYTELGDENFTILAVNSQEKAENIEAFGKYYGLTFPLLVDIDGDICQTFGVRGLPATFLIDRNGFVVAKAFGPRAWDSVDMIALFRELL